MSSSVRSRAASAAILLALTGIAAAGQDASRRGLDVVGYRIFPVIGPEAAAFRARTEIDVAVLDGGLNVARLDFVGLTVDSVRVANRASRFSVEAEHLVVELGLREAGDTIGIEAFYHGVPRDGLYFRANAHGNPTVFADNWPDRARFWFPGVDHPGDKATVEFHVDAPREWAVVANGRRRAVSEHGEDRRLTVWVTDRPIPTYTMVIGAGVMSVREVGESSCFSPRNGCLQITQWSYPEDEERARTLFRRAPEMVELFDSLIGPFPYEKLALVQSTTRYGGMENSSAIFFSERLAEDRAGVELVAHEIAHQWFGDAVTEREWPHLWLSEGFATYFASLFFELADGDTSAARVRRAAEERYLASARDVRQPVVGPEPEDLFELLNRNNYQKGAWVLHMLRELIGDDAFFAGIRRYYTEFLHSTALTADLQRLMEETSGQELSWFFDQWIHRPGYPVVEIHYFYDAERGVLDLQLEQVQDWPAFRLPLEVEAEGDGYTLRRTFWIDEPNTRRLWHLPGEPSRIRADPDNALLGPVRVSRR